MKSFLLAAAMAFIYVATITALFRCRNIERRARAMTVLFLLSLPVYLVAHRITPADLGFLPEVLTEPLAWMDLAFGMMLWTAAFSGGILQLYNLADRGFSLRIVMDIQNSAKGAMSLEEIYSTYSGGRGIGWMYQKRLDDLVHQRLASIDDGRVCNRSKGQRVALVFGWLRHFLKMESH